MVDKNLQTELLPYPLPPWQHRFRTLAVFCEVDEASIAHRVPKPLELSSNIVQVTVMHFESTVPHRPYYDSAVIAQVKHGDSIGGNWIYGFTSTDQVLSHTREVWGYNMKLAEMELHVDQDRVWGHTTRLGRRIVDINFSPTGRAFDVPEMFPRLFVKALPEADRPEAINRQVVMMVADTEITETRWGEAELSFEASDEDPLYQMKPTRILGACYTAGDQTLNWGRVIG